MLSVSKINFERYFEPVFEPVSFELKAGQLLLVTGTNGCGKTTLIRVLADILHPTSGDFVERTDSMGYVGHYLGIKDDLSVIENLRFMRDFLGTSNRSCEEVIRRSAWPASPNNWRARFRPASANDVHWPACCSVTPVCGCWTNPIPTWTRKAWNWSMHARPPPGSRRRLCTGHARRPSP